MLHYLSLRELPALFNKPKIVYRCLAWYACVRNARVSLAFRAAHGGKASGRGFAWTTFEGKCALSRLDRGS